VRWYSPLPTNSDNTAPRVNPVRYLRLLLAFAAVAGLTGTGCKAMDNDPILGNKPFQPNMSLNQGG
jgi:hypothetical protein